MTRAISFPSFDSSDRFTEGLQEDGLGIFTGICKLNKVVKLSLGPVQRISILTLKQNVSLYLSNNQPSHLQHL